MTRPTHQQFVEAPCKQTAAYKSAHHAVKNLITSLPNVSGDPIDVQADKVISYLISCGWIHNVEASHVHHDWDIELNRTLEEELPDSPEPT